MGVGPADVAGTHPHQRTYPEPVARQGEREPKQRFVVPPITFPAELPVSAARLEIAEAIRNHQVVVVAGETGSGKTTQLPKICLELGRGQAGLIGHTQPRRLAARTVAERIADELGTPLGTTVGYQVRFTDRVGPQTQIKLMTDGILLAELQRDRTLRRYDTLIIDEAHERSLNIDFIIGYLRQLLPRRRDLKLIITSATIDPGAFARHFFGAPVIEVSGRTYPVEVRYRPLSLPTEAPSAGGGGRGRDGGNGAVDEDAAVDDVEEPRDQTQGVCDAVVELSREGPGDILVFLSGEREIRDTADALAEVVGPTTEILPLYARLSMAEQHRVFSDHPGRRVVLATNVAETSLTVPGIRYVVDPGTARISRYSHRTKVQRLPIEPISQASARQRAGRCGRVADGICIRLYSEQDFGARPAFTDPEILRTSLASVILQMTSIGLGDIAAFPFLDPPDNRAVKDGLALLDELGALTRGSPGTQPRSLTTIGKRLAQLPIDPRLGRMVLQAEVNGCVREVIIIAAALSIQDVRDRPTEHREAADQLHRRFADPTSDFVAYLNLWQYLREQQQQLSSNQFRRMCRREYLNHLRIREWQDLVAQLRQIAGSVGVATNASSTDATRIHQSLLSGLLSHLGLRESDRTEFTGARSARFQVWPGSALFRKPPRWVMAGELVETSRLWGRDVARIEPEWVEPLAEHLVKRSYSEPHWEAKRGSVVALEKVTLYGLPIVSARTVGYGTVDPELSRELFLRHALVEGDWRTHHAFFAANLALLDDVEQLESRARRRDILVDDETLFDFYDERIPDHVVSGAHFDSWWKRARREDPELLDYSHSLLIAEGAKAVAAADFPDTWPLPDGGSLRLTYQFEPGTDDDGVTVHVPVQTVAGLDPAPFSWQIPGLRLELVTALLRSLPKAIRTAFVPAPDTARAVVEAIRAHAQPPSSDLVEVLARELTRRGGFTVPVAAFDLAKVPDHLRPTFRIEDVRGRVVQVEDGRSARGKDLGALGELLRPRVRAAVAAIAGAGIERAKLAGWDVGTLPRSVERQDGGRTVSAYPALVDEGGNAAVRVLASAAEAERAMRTGTRRLLLTSLGDPLARLKGQVEYVLPQADRLSLALSRYPSVNALLEDCLACAVDDLVVQHGGPAWDGEAFETLLTQVRTGIDEAGLDVVRSVSRVLAQAGEVERAISSTSSLALLPMLTDVRAQLGELVPAGFVAEAGRRRLPDLLRYLRAVSHRLARAPENVNADRGRMDRVAAIEASVDACVAGLPPSRREAREVSDVRAMVQELRVSVFAQGIGTAYPISEQRIEKALAAWN
jgi:ATP-dependent helicase HrpA